MDWTATALSDADNVATVMRPVHAGETIVVAINGRMLEVTALGPIALCHKIALSDLAEGDPVIKYGECIGVAVAAIRRGAWVHTHNLRSRRAQARSTQ